MRIAPRLTPALVFAALLGACARNPRPTTPSPQPAPPASQPAPVAVPAPAPAPAPDAAADLSGDWQFAAAVGDRGTTGTLTLTRAGEVYSGSARGDDGELYPMISLTRTGGNVVMLFDTPSGTARVESTLTGGSLMSGTLVVGDATGTFTARRK
jgi:hypothetical protein